MKKNFVSAVTLVMFGLGSSVVMAAPEAVVAQAQGKVMVDSGKGFVPVKAGAALQNGDRVVALKASSATINFAQGCALSLAENNLVTISKEAGCATKVVAVNRAADPSAVAAVGDDDRVGLVPFIVAGGLAGGLVIAGATNGKDEKPISSQ